MVLLAALTLVRLLEQGYAFWIAVAATLGVMVVLAVIIERIVLRPLVNQPLIILFMATIGLNYFLEGFAQGVWDSQTHGLELGIPDVSGRRSRTRRASSSASSTSSRRPSAASSSSSSPSSSRRDASAGPCGR